MTLTDEAPRCGKCGCEYTSPAERRKGGGDDSCYPIRHMVLDGGHSEWTGECEDMECPHMELPE